VGRAQIPDMTLGAVMVMWKDTTLNAKSEQLSLKGTGMTKIIRQGIKMVGTQV